VHPLDRGAFAAIVADPDSALVATDFDGTIAPIVDHPEAARPLPAALEALRALQSQVGTVAVISGRPAHFLGEVLPVAGLVLVGQYGLERLDADGATVADPSVSPHLAAVAAALADARREFPDLYIERKGLMAATVHWRLVPERGDDVMRWADLVASRLGLGCYPTKMAVELRPPVSIDKGTALEDLSADATAVVFAGDDHGDLAAFDTLDRIALHGVEVVRIGVESSEAPRELFARADITVAGPAAVADLFSQLARRITDARGSA